MKIKILLDDSGSMEPVKLKVPIILKNAFSECKDHGVCCEVQLIYLNNFGNAKFTVAELARNKIPYTTNGGTPLYKKIISLLSHQEPNTLYIILSDGNADDKGYRDHAAEGVRRTNSISNNQIIYLGEGQGAFESARSIGIFNVLNFTKEDMEMLGRIVANEIIQYHNSILIS